MEVLSRRGMGMFASFQGRVLSNREFAVAERALNSVLGLPFVQCVTLGTSLTLSEPSPSLLKIVWMHIYPTKRL